MDNCLPYRYSDLFGKKEQQRFLFWFSGKLFVLQIIKIIIQKVFFRIPSSILYFFIPEWRTTVKSYVFHVAQDGSVRVDKVER